MNTALYISRRLSLSSDNGRKHSPAIGVGITSVALAVIVMSAAIAIVTGFKKEITSKVTGFNSEIVISATPSDSPNSDNAPSDSRIVSLTPSLRNILDDAPFISDYALQASIPAILKTPSDFKGAYLKSFSGRNIQDFISASVTDGKIPDFDNDSSINKIVISSIIASRLNLKVGDRIDTYFITDRLVARPLTVAAIYNSHFDAYDDASVYGAISLVQQLASLSPSQGSSIVISTDNFDNVEDYSAALRNRLINDYAAGKIYRLYNVTDAMHLGASYFHWLGMLDTNVIVILSLMTIVAIVSLISGMFILMVDKIRFIALMSALGAPRRMISRIFVILSAKIAVIGLLIGDILSLGILYLQKTTHFIPLDPDSYYIDFVPVEISIPAILLLNLAILFIIILALILPARYAGKAAPARTLAKE